MILSADAKSGKRKTNQGFCDQSYMQPSLMALNLILRIHTQRRELTPTVLTFMCMVCSPPPNKYMNANISLSIYSWQSL